MFLAVGQNGRREKEKNPRSAEVVGEEKGNEDEN